MCVWDFQRLHYMARVEASNWLEAFDKALDELALHRDRVSRVFALSTGEGTVCIFDGHRRFRVLARPGPEGRAGLPRVGEWSEGIVGRERITDVPPIREDLRDALFMESHHIASARSPHEASDRALDLLHRVSPCEASSVLVSVHTYGDFEFMAVRGPVAEQLMGRVIPYDAGGIVRHVHDTGFAVLTHDAMRNARHLHGVSHATGYQPRSILAVPLRDDEGNRWGVIELLDSRDVLTRGHVETASEVGLYLASYLSRYHQVLVA